MSALWDSLLASEGLRPRLVCEMLVVTRLRMLICSAAAMGASYAFASTVSANLRQKNDSWNNAIGGLFGGSMIGLTRMAHIAEDMAVLVC
jgi:hypothetical protein